MTGQRCFGKLVHLRYVGRGTRSAARCWARPSGKTFRNPLGGAPMRAARSLGLARGLAVALLLGAVLETPVRADLVGLYRFEDVTNPGKDSSPAGNDLTAFGGWSIDPSGRYGQGIALNGFDG